MDFALGEDRGFGEGCWSVDQADDDPIAVLISGRQSGNISVNFERASALLQTLELDDDDGGTVMALAWWPGLERAEELCERSVGLRSERTEQMRDGLNSGEPGSSFWGGSVP